MPANGSSSRMNFGATTSARVIIGPPPLPTREGVGRRVGQRRQVKLRQQFLEPCAARRRVQIHGFEDGEDVLLDRQPPED